MDATQRIDDSYYEEEDEDEEKEQGGGLKERKPLAALKVFQNNYIPETEVLLYQGENVLGRDPSACSSPLLARSISSRHAVISISVFQANNRCQGGSDGMEALLWDLGSLNGTRKGRVKLTPHVRYALTEGDSVVLADLPCQYIALKNVEKNEDVVLSTDREEGPAPVTTGSEAGTGRGVENGGQRCVLPPVPLWGDKETNLQSPQTTPRQPERTLVPESDSDSDGEKEQQERRQFLESASSDLSSPTCSAFLTPANKVIPESEDESSITPSLTGMARLLKKENHSEASSDSLKPVLPKFIMDSDTEEEVYGTKSEPQAKISNPPQVCLRVDSDTDVEDEGMEKTKSPTKVVELKQSVTSAGRTMDHDTDVEDNEPFRTETNPLSGTKDDSEHNNYAEFHMDSDTDLEDEDGPMKKKLEESVSIPVAIPVAEFHIDSDTDAEEEEKPILGEAVKLISDSDTDDDPFKPAKDNTMENLKILRADNSSSDTDVEDHNTGANNQPQRDSAAQIQPPAQKAQDEFRMDSDTDVEEEEKEEREIKDLEKAAGIFQSSTPRGAGLSEEEMETQAFLSPTMPFKRPNLPSFVLSSVSPGVCTQDSDDFTVAETQSFVSDALAANEKGQGASPFQLGLSDSSHQQPDSEMPTEAAIPAEEDWTLQPTQPYAVKMLRGRGSNTGLSHLDLEDTQAYAVEEGGEEEIQPLEEGNEACDTNGVPIASKKAGKTGDGDREIVDSHPSTADTLILIRSPKPEEQTQPYALFTAQTLPLGEEEEGKEFSDEIRPNVRLCKGEEVDEAQTQAVEPNANIYVTIAETLPMTEEEEAQEEEISNEAMCSRKTHRGRKMPFTETTKTFEPESNNSVATVETQPVGEYEEEHVKEQSKTTRGPHRGKEVANVEPTQPLEPGNTNVAVAEEAQEDKKQSGLRRSCRERKVDKTEPTKPLVPETSSNVAIAAVQPMSEGEEKCEKGKRSRPTGRKIAKDEPSKPLKPDASTHVPKAETEPVIMEEEAQEKEQQSSKKNVRGKEGRYGRGTIQDSPEKERQKRGRVLLEEEEDSKEELDLGRKSRGRKTMRQKSKEKDGLKLEEEKERGTREEKKKAAREEREQVQKDRLEREEREKDEFEERENAGNKIKKESLEQEKKEKGRELLEKEKEERETREKEWMEEAASEPQEKEKKEREEERQEMEQTKREENERLEKEKKEREEKEKLESEKREREEKERLEKEKKEREEEERQEMEKTKREENERLEKEKKEREEKEKLECEKREREEKEKLESEKREREEKERFEREKDESEKREREELVQRLGKQRVQEEKETLENTNRKREEKEQTEEKIREKEKPEKEDGLKLELGEKGNGNKKKEDEVRVTAEKEKKQLRGKRNAGLLRKESEGIEDEGLDNGSAKKESTERTLLEKEVVKGEMAKAKPGRGRRLTRKSTAPSASTEESASIDVPAKRTRSRSNSSNSVTSEQSMSILDDQVKGRGHGRSRGRKPVEEMVENSRLPARRKTVTPPSNDLERGACIHTRSNSGSSERSSSSAGTQNKGKGGKGRKSVKVEKPDEEDPRGPTAAPRGRGRGGKHLVAGVIKAEAVEQAHQEDKLNTVSVKEDSVTSQTPSRGRKRGPESTIAETPQPTKTPRRSVAGQTHKVLFTGVVDEDGEKVLVRLGGGLAKGVGDMTHLVTDKVRRTVKFLCAVARGVPIVIPDWLTKSGKAGTFLSSNEFLVKDVEQERKFNFNLQEALTTASRQPLLQGYEIHVTPSVKPEPPQMKDIIICCGARYLPKMPSAHKAQTVVVSCEEDRAQCTKALSLALPVVSAEFLLTGILQQKVDLHKHALLASPSTASRPATQGRRK